MLDQAHLAEVIPLIVWIWRPADNLLNRFHLKFVEFRIEKFSSTLYPDDLSDTKDCRHMTLVTSNQAKRYGRINRFLNL